MKFYKFHGTGNDFVMIENIKGEYALNPQQISKICDRHFGIGADGVILVESGKRGGDLFMNYWNADGSPAEMCGNGTRCTAHFVKEILNFDKKVLNLETRSGIKKIDILENHQFTVNMGKPDFENFSDFPRNSKIIGGIQWHFTSMGNPHAVGFFDSESNIDNQLETLGSEIESNTDLFPNKINANFVCKKGGNHFIVKTYERGAGPTLACGTGASASFAWIMALGKSEGKTKIEVPGGVLYFEFNDEGEILMTGPSEQVFVGVFNLF